MRWRNTGEVYGLVAASLHWLIALAIAGMILLGKYMVDLDEYSPDQFRLFQLHKSVGIVILTLSLLRLVWRLLNPPPPYPVHMRWWEKAVAILSHWAFYGFMLAIPLTGWAMVSASPWGIPTLLFGVIELPHLPWFSTAPDKAALEGTLKDVHELLSNLLIPLVALHVAAALKHELWDRDGVLLRIFGIARRKTA